MESKEYLSNLILLWFVSIVLLAVMYLQFYYEEPPNQFNFLQRAGLIGASVGIGLNVIKGCQTKHYGLILFSSIFGIDACGRQILSHIIPGTGGYGTPIFGLSLYTWLLIVFGCLILAVAALLLIHGWDRGMATTPRVRIFAVFSVALISFITLANSFLAFLECHLGTCPENPVYKTIKQEIKEL